MEIFNKISNYLFVIAIWSIIVTILQWCINTLSYRFNYEPITFWEVSATVILIIFIISIFNYAYTRKK